jgi:hypothetical protein
MQAQVARPLCDEPQIDLLEWRVMEKVPEGTVHFVGLNAATFVGGISTEIVEYDVVTREARSRSGRVYRLRGPAGFDGVSEYMWAAWCSHNHILEYLDLTDQYEELRNDDA